MLDHMIWSANDEYQRKSLVYSFKNHDGIIETGGSRKIKKSEGEKMMNEFMIQKAKELAAKAINKAVKYEIVEPEDMYVVWFCKTLQNWKALVSTSVLNSNSAYGDYVEVTHNGDKCETYCDVYKKQRNVCYKDGESYFDK